MNWKHLFFTSKTLCTFTLAEKILEAHLEKTCHTPHKYLREHQVFPPELTIASVVDEFNAPAITCVLEWEAQQARKKKAFLCFVQIHTVEAVSAVFFNDARGAIYWYPLASQWTAADLLLALQAFQQHIAKPLAIIGHGEVVSYLRNIPASDTLQPLLQAYPSLPLPAESFSRKPRSHSLPPHLQQLEDESIYILREAIAEAENPVMLYSIGKDSTALLHLAHKAFYPAPIPFELLHIDTRWKFQEMYRFRDAMCQHYQLSIRSYTHPEAIVKNINPFDHGASLHTEITKTQALKQAIDLYGFDVILGGARRDEEKSRAKERIFSLRSAHHGWDPKNQRPELWRLFNTQKQAGETFRVFPLSNWTEFDVWEYIYYENIPVVPLYFAQYRPVVRRNGSLILIDDNRLLLHPQETVELKKVRFRTLGCYPLTGAMESEADSVAAILLELHESPYSERQGRTIDHDARSSMEKKKREGYF